MEGIVSTIGQKCRRCYSCVRDCPATAIKVVNGQAVVITERCISCGHCVKVCSQNAKHVENDIDKVLYDLLPTNRAIAIIAPSFAASFPNNYNKIPGALKKIGFFKVTETAFGADLISPLYKKYFEVNGNKTIISSPCPAVYNYIEKYYTQLVPNLAEIVSPMIAMGKYLRENLGEDIKIVFIGPCIAKKSEYRDKEVDGVIDAVLTFTELKEIFETLRIDVDESDEIKFDPPHANVGRSFAISGGLIKTAEISSDILAKDVIIVEGMEKVEEIIQDIANEKIKSEFIDILFCEGCINGPGLDSELNFYSRRNKIIEYIESSAAQVDKHVWKSEIYNSRDIDFTRKFNAKSQRRPMPDENAIKEILSRTNKFNKSDELNCGACGYKSCRDYAIAIAKGLAEEDMCLPFLIEKLEKAYSELQTTQEQLQSAEKLASIGQLAAGVAHEINNPLGTIMLYSSMLKKDIEKGICENRNAEDLQMIIEEADRCKNIVSNLLNFARQGKLKISKVDFGKLIDNVIKSVSIKQEFKDVFINVNDQSSIELIDGDNDQLKQVFLNIITNACESLEESDVKNVNINVQNNDHYLLIDVVDTGCGIPEDNLKKLFTPFFTTKKMGKGTGLGLAISYGIIKMHKGDIKVKSNVGHGSVFTIKLPTELANNSFSKLGV